MSAGTLLGILHGLLWCAFFYFLIFKVIAPLQGRVREIEIMLLAIARVLADEGVGKGRIKIEEKTHE